MSDPAANTPRSLSQRAPAIAGPGTADLRDELLRIGEIPRPPGPDQDDVALADLDARGAGQVVGRDRVIVGQRLGAGDVQQHAAAEDRRDRVDRMPLQAAGVRLRVRRLFAAVELAAAREMAERVDMRAHVTAHRDRVGRRAVAGRSDVFAVLFHQAVQERRMRRDGAASR